MDVTRPPHPIQRGNSWGISRMEEAGIWRFWPRRIKLEPFYGSPSRTAKPLGFCLQSLGRANRPGRKQQLADLRPARFWCSSIATTHRRSFGQPEKGAKQAAVTSRATRTSPKPGRERCLSVATSITPSGHCESLRMAQAFVSKIPPLIKSTSRSFRPVDVKFGPEAPSISATGPTRSSGITRPVFAIRIVTRLTAGSGA